jgi:predicted amidophosphoribosyltransferase
MRALTIWHGIAVVFVFLVMAILMLKLSTKKCPHCQKKIPAKATKCSHCGEWVDKRPKQRRAGW